MTKPVQEELVEDYLLRQESRVKPLGVVVVVNVLYDYRNNQMPPMPLHTVLVMVVVR